MGTRSLDPHHALDPHWARRALLAVFGRTVLLVSLATLGFALILVLTAALKTASA